MFWKLIKFGYDKEHGLWNSTTRFFDEDEVHGSFNDSWIEGENVILLEVRTDGYWEIIDSVGMEEPGLMVVDKGFGVQTVEKDPAFIGHYQSWVALQNV